jgi:hypothetical protein
MSATRLRRIQVFDVPFEHPVSGDPAPLDLADMALDNARLLPNLRLGFMQRWRRISATAVSTATRIPALRACGFVG